MKVSFKKTSPNYRQSLSTVRIMNELTLGLLAVVAFSIFYFFNELGSDYGIKAISIYAVSVIVALVTEICYHAISGKKGKEIIESVRFSFPLVTALIFALTLPIGTPLYVVGVGAFIAIFFGKLVYGGFGQNVFNPALVGRVIVHLSFASQLTNYIGDKAPDVISGATPTTALKAASWAIPEGFMNLGNLFTGMYSAAIGETSTILILVIGVILAWRKVIEPRITVAYLGTVWVIATVVAMVLGQDVATYGLIHIALGGLAFGAVFMATDPVTSPTSPLGKIIFGIGLGFLTMIIRIKANYPEGVLFSILLMNMFTPYIDSLTLGRTTSKMFKQIMTICLALVISVGTVSGVATSLSGTAEEPEDPVVEEIATVIGKQDGGYLIEVPGFHKESPMQVLVKADGTNYSITVISYAGESEGYGKEFIEGKISMMEESTAAAQIFYDTYINGSFTKESLGDADVKTGATKTTKNIVEAIKKGIECIENDPIVSIDGNKVVVKGYGFGGKSEPMQIEVVVDKANQKVTSVKVLSYAGETEWYGKELIEDNVTAIEGGTAAALVFVNTVLKSSIDFSAVKDVDTATGATKTSKGIIEAIEAAISEMQNRIDIDASGKAVVSVEGFHGDIKVEVTVDKATSTVKSVKILEQTESEYYGFDLLNGEVSKMDVSTPAAQVFVDKVLKGSFAFDEASDIDVKTGATITSKAVMEAVNKVIAACK